MFSNNEKSPISRAYRAMALTTGFEPVVPFSTPPFQDGRINRSLKSASYGLLLLFWPKSSNFSRDALFIALFDNRSCPDCL